MIITKNSFFKITDNNTGIAYYAKGVYWHKKNIIVIAPTTELKNINDKINVYPIRVSAIAKDHTVEIIEA